MKKNEKLVLKESGMWENPIEGNLAGGREDA